MIEPPDSPLRVPARGRFRLASRPTAPKVPLDEQVAERKLRKRVEAIAALQAKLYAEDRRALLLIFQALDAAGKDGTIAAVLTGVNPAGVHVASFKAPSSLELDHDYLWRHAAQLPGRGTIGVHNRSWYEEVLAVRVHPEYLAGQRVPDRGDDLWKRRLAGIEAYERHLAENGTVILKFLLHVSADEQARRLIRRIDDPDRNWKFDAGDVRERAFRDAWVAAADEALRATSRPWAPWYVVPADHKPTMRAEVAGIVRDTLRRIDPKPRAAPARQESVLAELRAALAADLQAPPRRSRG